MVKAGFIEGGINHVVLCTDGDFNVGVSSTSALVELIVEKRRTGIALTVLGYGNDNLNDSMMEAVSNAGNGVYGVISNADQAIEYVNQRLLSTLVHIAKDMKIQVEFNPGRVYAYRLLGYENRAIADDDFRDDLVDAGEIGAGHRVTALYEIVPAGGILPMPEGAPAAQDGDAYMGPVEVAAEDFVLVKVRYKRPDASEADPAFEVATSLAPAAIAEKATDLGSDFAWALSVASFAEILKQSPCADPARISAITALVQLTEQLTRSDRSEFATLYSRALDLLPAGR